MKKLFCLLLMLMASSFVFAEDANPAKKVSVNVAFNFSENQQKFSITKTVKSNFSPSFLVFLRLKQLNLQIENLKN